MPALHGSARSRPSGGRWLLPSPATPEARPWGDVPRAGERARRAGSVPVMLAVCPPDQVARIGHRTPCLGMKRSRLVTSMGSSRTSTDGTGLRQDSLASASPCTALVGRLISAELRLAQFRTGRGGEFPGQCPSSSFCRRVTVDLAELIPYKRHKVLTHNGTVTGAPWVPHPTCVIERGAP